MLAALKFGFTRLSAVVSTVKLQALNFIDTEFARVQTSQTSQIRAADLRSPQAVT